MGPAPGDILPDKTTIYRNRGLKGKRLGLGLFFQPAPPEDPARRNGV
jgi:hypothetical protein